MYLVVSKHAVSVVLVMVHDSVQKPIYCVSKSLVDSQTRYLPLEKVALALIHSMRKLPHYFQAHSVYLDRTSITGILKRSYFTRRIAKRGTALGSFDIRYRSRSEIKG